MVVNWQLSNIQSVKPVSLLGLCNKVPQTGGLNQQHFFFPQIQDARNPSSRCFSRFGFSWGFSRWLSHSHLPTLSSYDLPSMHIWVLKSSSYKDTSHVGLGPLKWSHFNLISSVQILSQNPVNFSGTRDCVYVCVSLLVMSDSLSPHGL